jgi:hypothetical protein
LEKALNRLSMFDETSDMFVSMFCQEAPKRAPDMIEHRLELGLSPGTAGLPRMTSTSRLVATRTGNSRRRRFWTRTCRDAKLARHRGASLR